MPTCIMHLQGQEKKQLWQKLYQSAPVAFPCRSCCHLLTCTNMITIWVMLTIMLDIILRIHVIHRDSHT